MTGSKGLHVREFKGMPAVFDGDRLVTRTNDPAKAEAYLEQLQAAGVAPFSSEIAPWQPTEPSPVPPLERDDEPAVLPASGR